jgi:hypothetical protein
MVNRQSTGIGTRSLGNEIIALRWITSESDSSCLCVTYVLTLWLSMMLSIRNRAATSQYLMSGYDVYVSSGREMEAHEEWNRFRVLLILDDLGNLRAYLVKRNTCQRSLQVSNVHSHYTPTSTSTKPEGSDIVNYKLEGLIGCLNTL